MIDIKSMLAVFSGVFMAELGDKTQLATVCFMAGGGCRKSEVFIASSSALILSTLLAVILGSLIGHTLSGYAHLLKIGAGALFIIMGTLFVRQGFKMPLKNREGDPCG